MITCIEHLPIELWVEIFSYLEAHIIFQGFTNLNYYFNQILTSNYILFHVQLGVVDCNPLEYSIKPYWSESILNRIINLQPKSQHQLCHIPEFLRWHCTKLSQLKSLTIKIRGREIRSICYALEQLNSLVYLSIECVPDQILLDAILATSTVRFCRLDFLRPVTPINTYSKNLSNIEILNIKLQDDSYGSIMNLLLSHMPKLKRLEMNNNDIYVKNREWIFFQSLFILPNLRKFKAQWSSNYSVPIVFQNLHTNLPNIRYFSLHINFNFINEEFFDHLIYHWWPIFKNIEQIYLFIKCHGFSSETDNNDTRIYLNRFQSIIHAMNEQYVKTKWNETIFTGTNIVDISICKSFKSNIL
ncbi:unnamed protein product [Adineta steineri]|uniref:F-box domain-containing protein n=1 Tax=Adineta steineri TaxID=433720 RepID=A0A819U2J4_9BILA|nr:unnamed protein product [Adineta steineri]